MRFISASNSKNVVNAQGNMSVSINVYFLKTKARAPTGVIDKSQ